jgi:copper chaperone CopZ
MTTIKVNNMSCGHCVKNIDNALQKLKLEHEINLEQKTLKVEANNLELFDVFEALDEMGYDAEKIE